MNRRTTGQETGEKNGRERKKMEAVKWEVKARSRSSLIFRERSVRSCVFVCESTAGQLGVKTVSCPSLFLLYKLPCPLANQSKTNIAFHSLDLFE